VARARGTTDAVLLAGEALLAPLDRLRAALLGALGRAAGPWMADPLRRAAWLGSLGLASTLALTILAPGLLLALGPIVLGVPHLVSDLRYLVLRPRLHRVRAFLVLALVPCALAFFWPVLEVAGLALVGAAVGAPGPVARELSARPARHLALLRRAPVAALGVTLVFAGRETGRLGELLFAHAHNALAVFGLLAVSAPRARRRLAPFALLAAVFATLLLAGVVPTEAAQSGAALRPFELDAWSLAATLSPLDDPALAHRFVALFAFGQALHYLVWLRLVPELARPRRGPRSFRQSLRALRAELGAPLLLGALVLAAALPAWGTFELGAARDAYLRLALFHGPLELAAFAALFIAGRAPWACWSRAECTP
jgi:hypothetical protein